MKYNGVKHVKWNSCHVLVMGKSEMKQTWTYKLGSNINKINQRKGFGNCSAG